MNTQTKIITRQEYMNNEATHREDYGQFVSKTTKGALIERFGLKKIVKHIKTGDDIGHKDRIQLQAWDNTPLYMGASLEDAGDFLTAAGKVCILKEAARQLAEAA